MLIIEQLVVLEHVQVVLLLILILIIVLLFAQLDGMEMLTNVFKVVNQLELHCQILPINANQIVHNFHIIKMEHA